MGGSTKKILGYGALGLAAGLTGGAALSAIPALGIGLGTGAAVGGVTGALSGVSAGASAAGADKQAAIAREANKQAEIQQKREAGMAPTAINQGDTITDTLRKKSAIRRSILTGTSKTAQKLGD